MPIWSLALAALAFGAHLLLWRVRVPRRQTRVLLRIFFGVLATGLAALTAAAGRLPGWLAPTHPVDLARIALAVTAFALAYAVTYSALQVDSPSLLLSLRIAAAGPAGVTADGLIAELSDEMLVVRRLEDLVRDEGIAFDGERYRILPRARRYVRFIGWYRGLMRLPRMGG